VGALALQRGFGGIPFLTDSAVGSRVILPMHGLTAGIMVALASGMGVLVESAPHEHVSTGTRWLLCGCVAAFSVIGACCGLASGRGWIWALRIVPGLALPVLVGVLALTATLTVWLLTLAVVVQLAAKPRKSDVEATA
jgi:hypothetical protein